MGLTFAPTVSAYLAVVAAVALLRFAELAISARHRRALAAAGALVVHEPHFKWMAALHTAILAGAALEVVVLRRPFVPALAMPALMLLIAATWTRWWVIQTLGQHWNVGVMDSTRQGVVDTGPYRWVRHPNYTAVFVELLALPLIHTAWITAVLGTVAHVFVLRARVAAEDRVLLASADYAARMGGKPSFFPTRL
ncbi:MAG TPA: isoprenylcysteine carboxylmethyltransferase family protein [Vicinamibacterales bacterium]|nr:isoprenylcysteine carboxylmethyltransferase family protein [Vicinamibacterales bacterium]